jgi:hypothetical protein
MLTDAEVRRLRAAVGEPPTLFTLHCARCTREFKTKELERATCFPCLVAEQKHGHQPIQGGFSGC